MKSIVCVLGILCVLPVRAAMAETITTPLFTIEVPDP